MKEEDGAAWSEEEYLERKLLCERFHENLKKGMYKKLVGEEVK